jgi:tetratricopeptide (TPR) repeat protein
MGASRYSPEGLQADEFPLDLRYKIDALYKLALSSFYAGKYEDTLHYVKKALEKDPSNSEMLELLSKIEATGSAIDLSYFDRFRPAVLKPGQPQVPAKVLAPVTLNTEPKRGQTPGTPTTSLDTKDLFSFDDDAQKRSAQEPARPAPSPQGPARTANPTALEPPKEQGTRNIAQEDRGEAYKDIRKQLDKYKAEGFLITKIEAMLGDRTIDTKRIQDSLIIFDTQVSVLRDLKKRASDLANAPGVNKARLFSLKLKLSDPDKVKEAKSEIEDIIRSANASQDPAVLKQSLETQKKIKALLEQGLNALKQKDLPAARGFFESVLKLDPQNKPALDALERFKLLPQEVRRP